MSYVVANIDKFTQTSVKAIEKHVERTSDNFKNTDIDKSKTHLNYSLKDCDNYNKKINEILDEKMTSGRKICTTGKNASVVMCGCVISSDTDFFNTLNEKQQREYFEKSLEYMKSKVDKIFKAEVHLDEKTPHLHLYFVPLTPDGRLSGKEVISRKFLKDLQNELPKHLKNSGFKIERGAENSTRKHTDTSKYKRELNVKINEIEKVEKIEKQTCYKITPRNSEQIFALHALLNPNVKLVSLQGVAGTGKTLLALAGALQQKKEFKQIYLARPIVPLSNKELGFLPGDANAKISPYMEPLWDNLKFIQSQYKETDKEFKFITDCVKVKCSFYC